MPSPPPTGSADGPPRDRVVRDPVHGYVDVPGALDPLVRTPALQRLHAISQNARATVRYPSLTGSRYEHALGTMHLARRAWSRGWAQTVAPAGLTVDETRAAFRRDVITGLRALPHLDDTTAALVGAGTATPAEETPLWQDFDEVIGVAVAAVGLLHDLGHPPFSHILEPFYARHAGTILGPDATQSLASYAAASNEPVQFHEWAGLRIFDTLPAGAFRHLPRALIRAVLSDRSGAGWAGCLHGIIDGQFDVDRLDYLVRDAARAGTEFGAIDAERLLQSLELHRVDDGWRIGLGARSISAFETLLVQRAQQYRWVVHHYAVVAADTALARAVDNVHALAPLAGIELPDLDYVSAAAGVTERDGAVVDDHDCLAWLRSTRGALEKLAASGGPEETTRLAAATLVLLRAADTFDVAPVPAWRNYQEFIARTEQHAALVDAVGAAHPADPAAATRDLRTGAGTHAVQALLADLPARLNLSLDSAVETLGGDAGLRGIEALLDRLHPDIPVCGGPGFWLVARVPFLAFREAFANIWRGDDEVALSRVSPFPLALTAIEVMRPRYLVYFLPLDGSPADATKEQRREVGRRFFDALSSRR